jgi:hypothetical protein
MPWVGFEPTIPVLYCAKTFQIFGRAATKTGAADLFVENIHAWRKTENVGPIIQGHFKAVDAFTAPRFSATGMLSTARCMRVLSMTQHARRPITFMNENNKPVHDFSAVGSCYRCHERFLPSKYLVSSVLRHGSLYFRATRICVWHLREIRICWKVSAKISWWKSSQQTKNSQFGE